MTKLLVISNLHIALSRLRPSPPKQRMPQTNQKSILMRKPLLFLQNAVARSLDVLVKDDLSDGTVADETGARILD